MTIQEKPAGHAREELFREWADALPHLVWMAEPDGAIVWFSQRWGQYTGAEAMTEPAWEAALDPAALPQVLERWRQSLTSGEPFEMALPLRGRDGVFRTFLAHVAPVRDSHGGITHWIATHTEIDAQARALVEQDESRLATALEAAQRLAAIVESSDDAIVSKDLNGMVTSWNRGAERMFGHTAASMIGASINIVIPPEFHADEERFLAMIARGERLDHYETRRITASGRLIDVSLTLSPVRDEAGNIVGVAKIARDITHQKKAERALHTSDRLATVGRLAATIAHEINNPLAAVTNLIFLARLNSNSAEIQDLLDRAEEELMRVSQLTKQTLGFFRGAKGMEAQSLAALINDLLPLYASRVRSKAMRIETQFRQDPTVWCVPGEIRQIVANLLNNSLDALGSSGKIVIRIATARAPGGGRAAGVRLTIADSGSGVPVAVRQHLFEPFFTTKKDVGTGLGLWVSKGLVEKHGGTMRVRSSVVPGKSGTVFSMFFPLNAAQSE